MGELKRLHTFPDAYALPDSLALARQQVGNAVPPQLARLLALAVAEQVFGLPLPFPLAYLGHGEELGFAKRKRLLTAFYRRQAASAQLREGERGEGILRLQAGVKGYRFLPEGGPFEAEVRFQGARLSVWLKGEGEGRILVRGKALAPSPVREVSLEVVGLSEAAYLAAWKALEYGLRSFGLKWDLVQLAGHYRARPRLAFQGEGFPEGWWQALGHLLEGRGLGVPKPLEELEEILGLAPGEGQGFLAWARGLLGIDVRSRCTNPNLPEGSYLVPYPFPTLSERSVMARKPLFCQEGKEP